jgi:hypothetical protein
LYVGRVEALFHFEHDLIKWHQPGTLEYQHTIDMHLLLFGFPKCLGMVDGNLLSNGGRTIIGKAVTDGMALSLLMLRVGFYTLLLAVTLFLFPNSRYLLDP